MAALGMTVIIMAGGIDLSAGTALALAATVLAYVLEKGYGVHVAIFTAIMTGAIAGLVNGTLISFLRLAPFIVTLGTMTFYLGLAKLIANETTIRPPLDSIPLWLNRLMSPQPKPAWQLLPLSVWMTLVMALLTSGLMNFTVFGRHVRAVGANEPTAILCGIRVARLKICVYTLAGALVGLAGMFQFARLATGNPMSGIGMELRMIAAVVIGGASLMGGRGSMFGTIIGAGITSVIANGCSMLKLDNPLQDMVLGVIIVAAVLIDRIRSRGA
jgi:ribose transport system permease protein